MSINEAYLLVNTSESEALVEQLAAYLRRWQKDIAPRISPRFDDPADWGVDEAWRRSYLLWPSEGGWSVLIDGARQNSLPGCAEHLARALKTTAVWYLLLGGCYLWRHRIYDHGREVKSGGQPEGAPPLRRIFPRIGKSETAGTTETPEAGTDPMPLAMDVEAAGYAFLGTLGVPPRLRLVQHDTRIPPGVAQDELDYSGWEIRLEGLAEGIPKVRVERQPLVKPSPLTEVPVRFDSVGKDRRGRRCFIEQRRVWGRPTPKALERLLETELEVRNRQEYPFLALPGPAAPALRFDYQHETLGKEELEQRLAVRRCIFERRHPSQRQFLHLARRVLAKNWPGHRVGETVRFGFQLFPDSRDSGAASGEAPATLKAQRRSWVIRLDNAYREYRRQPEALSPAAFLSKFFERVFSALQEALPQHWEAVRECLLPRLWSGNELPEPLRAKDSSKSPMPMRAAAHGLWAGLVYEREGGLFQVNAAVLAQWGVDFDTAFDAALAALAQRTPGNGQGAELDEWRTPEGGRVLSVRYGDGNASARALLRPFREALLRRLGDAAAIVAFPGRDLIRAVAASDPFGIEALRETLLRTNPNHPPGRSPELFRLTAQHLSRYENWPR